MQTEASTGMKLLQWSHSLLPGAPAVSRPVARRTACTRNTIVSASRLEHLASVGVVAVPMARLPVSASYAGVVFLVFGFGSKQQHLGPGETRTCPHCGNPTQGERIRELKHFSLFFAPVARWNRRQLEVCGICGTAIEV